MKIVGLWAFTFFFIYGFNSAVQAQTVLFLGDSLTDGYGVAKESSYPEILLKKLKGEGKVDVKILNVSVSGSTTASADTLLRWQLKAKPQILVLALGANDGLRAIDLSASKSNLEKVIKMAQKEKMKILLVGLEMPTNYGKKYTDEFKKMYVDLAKKYRIPLVPQLLKNVAGIKNLNQDDGIHPNEQGHEIMAQNVYPELKKLL
jgi:acyl-CoA thioesterase-1